MLKIHDFARLGEVSTTTLRYYDEIGLLIPASVDPQTGYRFYTINQLSHLHRILALKELGLGLAQITQIIHEEVSPEELQGMLRLKQAELQQRIRAEQEQLTRLEARLNYFEQGCSMPTYEVVLKAVKPLTAISQPFSRADLAHKGHSANTFLEMVKQYGIKPIDSLLIFDEVRENGHPEYNLRIAVPVKRSEATMLVARSAGRLALCELPAVAEMASTLHRGSPQMILKALQALGAWMETNAYTIVGPRRGVCLRWEGDLHDSLTEIQFPVEKVS